MEEVSSIKKKLMDEKKKGEEFPCWRGFVTRANTNEREESLIFED